MLPLRCCSFLHLGTRLLAILMKEADEVEKTVFLHDMISHCDDLEAFRKEILPSIQDAKMQWQERINSILTDNHYTKTDLARLCEVTRPAVAKWCNGALPGSREDYIKIGFAAHYNYDEMNFFLQRYGKYSGLYAKSLEDSVYIFVLNSVDLEHSYAVCKEILEKIRKTLQWEQNDRQHDTDTYLVDRDLRQLTSTTELQAFIASNTAIYQTAYAKLYAYINAFIAANNYDAVRNCAMSIHSLANLQNWSSSLRKCVSAIQQKKWFPLRRKVIVLGLYLNMNVDQINTMLGYAKMEPLCAKNPIESAIIFAVNDAELNNMICQDGGTELCDYVKYVVETMDIAGAELVLQDL